MGADTSVSSSCQVSQSVSRLRAYPPSHQLPVFGVKEAASVTVNDDIYLIGGYNNAMNILQLDIPTQQWLNATTLEYERIGSAAVAVDTEIWIIGESYTCRLPACNTNVKNSSKFSKKLFQVDQFALMRRIVATKLKFTTLWKIEFTRNEFNIT